MLKLKWHVEWLLVSRFILKIKNSSWFNKITFYFLLKTFFTMHAVVHTSLNSWENFISLWSLWIAINADLFYKLFRILKKKSLGTITTWRTMHLKYYCFLKSIFFPCKICVYNKGKFLKKAIMFRYKKVHENKAKMN